MTASKTSDGERLVSSDDQLTAFEFVTADEIPPEGRRNRLAHAIVWFDRRTPIYTCSDCHEHVATLEWEGPAIDGVERDRYEEIRFAAYRRLYEGRPLSCLVCSGTLPTALGPDR